MKSFKLPFFVSLGILLIAFIPCCGTDSNDLDVSDVDLDSFQISVSIDGNQAPEFVRAGVTALDSNGDTVRLSTDEIRIYESKDRENWTEVDFEAQRRGTGQIPISVAVAMDYSGSMTEQMREDSENAVVAFVENLIEGDQMAIIKFAEDVEVEQDFTSDGSKIKDALHDNSLDWDQWGTAVWDAADKGVDLAKSKDAPKAVVITSDGEDNASDTKASELVENAVKSGVPIFTLGFAGESENGLKFLYKVSEDTGGLFYQFESTSEMKSVYMAIADAFNEALVTTWSSEMASGKVYVKVVVNTDGGDSKTVITSYSF